jgi:hypothetical protein
MYQIFKDFAGPIATTIAALERDEAWLNRQGIPN